ncbi:MAG: collagen-like protein [Bacteroidetes bacterium]|nr:collagen-like protein [Bacteroidota bacterium]
MKTETDPTGGTTYSITGTTELLSVPYALYAKTSGSSTAGPAGPTGLQGIQGIQGVAGNDGAVGPTGPIGLTGATGAAGANGAAGAAGPIGTTGLQGPSGLLTVNCLECHDHSSTGVTNPLAQSLSNAQNEIEFSKHAEGFELAIGEGGSAGCAPCHSHEGYHSVVDGNVQPTMQWGSSKYTFNYNATAAASSGLTTMPGKISCFTCHKGAASDSMHLYSTAAVPMTMWPVYDNVTNPGGTVTRAGKTINLTQKNSQSNLCVKCHQPRPMSLSTSIGAAATRGASVDYADLVANPSQLFYDATQPVTGTTTNTLIPSYRMHNHYGAVGAIYAGQGAVEFTGTATYSPSAHQTAASCQDCHMAPTNGMTGGHSFKVAEYDEVTNPATTSPTTLNLKGCNVSGCHLNSQFVQNGTSGAWVTKWLYNRNNTKALLDSIANRLRSNGVEIMHKNTDPTSNIFAHVTTAGYDGYLNIYDPSTNPLGGIKNPNNSSYTAAQAAVNNALPSLVSLNKAKMGAIINFQLSVREYSLGIHNPSYTMALLQNTLETLRANP